MNIINIKSHARVKGCRVYQMQKQATKSRVKIDLMSNLEKIGQQIADKVEKIAASPMVKFGPGAEVADLVREIVSYQRLIVNELEALKNGK